MVANMHIISPKKGQFKPVFFGLFDFFKMKRPRPDCKRPTNSLFQSWSCLVLVQFGCSLLPVLGLDFQTLVMHKSWDSQIHGGLSGQMVEAGHMHGRCWEVQGKWLRWMVNAGAPTKMVAGKLLMLKASLDDCWGLLSLVWEIEAMKSTELCGHLLRTVWRHWSGHWSLVQSLHCHYQNEHKKKRNPFGNVAFSQASTSGLTDWEASRDLGITPNWATPWYIFPTVGPWWE